MKASGRSRGAFGFTLIEVTVVGAIIASLTALVVPGILRSRTVANESLAKGTLRTISNGIEMYLSATSSYPTVEADLLAPAANPPYLAQAYDGQTLRGYKYEYDFTNGYTVTATPEACGRTGSKVFTLTNNTITEAACINE